MTSLSEPNIARIETFRSFARLFLYEPEAPELRVEFARLFIMNVFPYASVYLDPEAFLNTETTARVQAVFERAGFELPPNLAIGAPDHFGVELLFIAYLLEAGHGAAEFLNAELVPWAGTFLHAVERNASDEFYRRIARETRFFLLDQGDVGEWRLAPVPAGEEDLDSVVSRLITPLTAGFLLSKSDLALIARRLELPAGFGDRALVLKSLFRAAGEYGRVEDLLTMLKAEAEDWIRLYADDAHSHPKSAAVSEAWRERAAQTASILEAMWNTAKEQG